MPDTVILAPAGYEVDPDSGSDPERPWRLIEGLNARGLHVVAIARRVARVSDLGSGVDVRLMPGALPTTETGRLFDRIRLYLYARRVALQELRTGGALAVHHFAPCSRNSPSFLPSIPVPFIYGPMPGRLPTGIATYREGDWHNWLGGARSFKPYELAGLGFVRVFGGVAEWRWRQTIKRADAVTVEARHHIPPERPDAVVIPMGLDVGTFRPNKDEEVAGRIVAVGALVRRKGFDVLIRALASARREVPSLHAVIAGEGPARTDLEHLAGELGVSSFVRFVGRLPRNELPSLYRTGQMGCHPARYDNFPTALVEAMASGLPVLVSDSPPLPEMAGDAGLVHPVGDADALSEQVVTATRDTRLRRALADAARERAVTVYSLDTMCESYLRLYEKLFAETRH